MDKESNRQPIGALAMDLTTFKDFLKDLPYGSRQGLRTSQEGCYEAVHEMESNQVEFGERAGIMPRDIEALTTARSRIALIDAQLPAARKIVELLEDTRAVLDDQIQRIISAAGQTIEARAKAFDDTELLARYDKTRAYRSAVGYKAAKTRRRNEAELEQPVNGELPEEPGSETPPANEAI